MATVRPPRRRSRAGGIGSKSKPIPASVSDLYVRFAHPQVEDSAFPFWFWNGDLEPAELLRQVRAMHDQGVRGFIIHCRLGCTVPYLSEQWFDRCTLVVEEAARLGMKVWIYDEDNWPSGYSGGRVMATDPTAGAKHLLVERHYVAGGTTPADIAVDRPGEVVRVMAMPIERVVPIPRHPLAAMAELGQAECPWTDRSHFTHHYGATDPIDLTITDGHLRWDAPPGHWCVMVFRQRQTNFCPTYCTSGYVDLLDPDVTRSFIRQTHEQYYNRLKRFFGNTIIGFFTDEPGFYNNFLDRDPGTVPWTGRLLAEFERRRRYALTPHLPALWEDVRDRSPQVRADYWQTVAELFEENFTGQIAAWCERHGVQLTGHLLIEESLLAMHQMCSNPFNVLRPLHVTGVDRIDEQDQKISEKLAASVAHANGRPRLISETFALIGWKLAPPYMKRIVDFQYARGVNWLVPHAFYYSIDDWRKMECPPSLFVQNPWWEHSRPLWDYVSRLSAILSQGVHVAPVALYYPIEQARATVSPHAPGPTRGVYPLPYQPFKTPTAPHPTEQTDAALNDLAFALTAAQYDFDLVDHALVAAGETAGRSVRIGTESFRAIVVPPMVAISAAALDRMLQFADDGGLVIFCGRLPHITLNGSVAAWDTIRPSLAAFQETGTLPVGDGRIGFVPVGEHGVVQLLAQEVPADVRVVQTAETRQRRLAETQHAQFRHTRLQKLSESLAYHRRQLPDADVYFVVNESDLPVAATLDLRGGGAAVERWHPETGARDAVPAHDNGDGTTRVPLQFAAWESQLLVLRSHATASPRPASKPSALWSLALDEWSLSVGTRRHHGELLSWHELGLPAFSGTGQYRAQFDLPDSPAPSAEVRLDLGIVFETARVRINGVALPPIAFPPYCVDVTAHLKAGQNTVEVEVANTLVNQLDGVERPSGLLGSVRVIATTAAPSAPVRRSI